MCVCVCVYIYICVCVYIDSILFATGAAVSMLLADLLQRLDVVKLISSFLINSMGSNPALPLLLQLANGVVQQNEGAAKRKLYAMAISTVRDIFIYIYIYMYIYMPPRLQQSVCLSTMYL